MTATAPVSQHKLILDAVRDTISGLSIDGISSSNVKVCWFPAAEQLQSAGVIANLPTVLVSPYGSEDMSSGGTNIGDDYGYPALVSIVAATDQNLSAHLDKYLYWREQITKAFHNKRLSGVTNVWRCVARPGAIADFAAFQSSSFWASYVSITCFDRNNRS